MSRPLGHAINIDKAILIHGKLKFITLYLKNENIYILLYEPPPSYTHYTCISYKEVVKYKCLQFVSNIHLRAFQPLEFTFLKAICYLY